MEINSRYMSFAFCKNKLNSPLLFILSFLLGSIGSTSCKKQETSEFTDTPIIESYLQPGNYFTVNIRRQIPFSDNVKYSSDDINNLAPEVRYNNLSYTLTPLGEGKYIDSTIILSAGNSFDLSFQFNSKKVTAYTYVPSKPASVSQSATEMHLTKIDSTFTGPQSGITQPDPVIISWDNPEKSYYLIVIENIETNPEPVRDFGTGTPPANRFRKSPTNFSVEEINSREFQYFGTYRIILFHVLPDYAALYNQSNTSSQNLSNPSTSIVNGYGIFTGLNSDTLYVEIIRQ